MSAITKQKQGVGREKGLREFEVFFTNGLNDRDYRAVISVDDASGMLSY